MKVLFVPLPQGTLPHLFPLLALNKQLDPALVQTAFLVPAQLHQPLRTLKVNVLDVDYSSRQSFATLFRSELMAYGRFNPDVVVDDTNPPTAFATAVAAVARATIQRFGMFPGSEPKDPTKRYANEFFSWDIKEFPNVSYLGIPQPQSVLDFFKAEAKIVPSTPSVEVLPEALKSDPTYYYAGPLMIDDLLIDRIGDREVNGVKTRAGLQAFFARHEHRRKVFATYGTTARAKDCMLTCIRALLNRGIAVVTSIPLGAVEPAQQDLLFYAPWLPMHFVCSHVDLMVHQGSTGTYQYALSHGVPAITVGTTFYDHESVAQRLESLGLSVHLPSPDSYDGFVDDFNRAINAYLDGDSAILEEKKRNLAWIHEEIRQTAARFNFINVLHAALRHRHSALSA